jgi:mannose-6-phosphate isomerase-like protein (cupin superfamily)
MAGLQVGDFDSPDEVRSPDKTTVAVVRMDDESTAARLTLQPGWRWSECIKPVAGTDSCQLRHVGVVQSGRMHVSHEDGTEMDVGPGNSYVIAPGHDAWVVVGEEPFVAYEFESKSAEAYARE